MLLYPGFRQQHADTFEVRPSVVEEFGSALQINVTSSRYPILQCAVRIPMSSHCTKRKGSQN
jgi:hypothetical protein